MNNKIEKIFIAKDIQDKIIADCQKNYPKEACGILAGKAAKAASVYPLVNISDKPEFCYLIDPKEQLKIFKELRAQELDLVAIYHSHTESPAYPSAKDLELAFYPESFYVIVSLADKFNPQIRAFRIAENNVTEVSIRN
ncbi:MAG: M67 family metallopeptidase [Candidatus Omnitrophota bacterium]|nr:M67 family metallopeptidase [Candidatus Omnitrophota bacterium]